MSRGGSRAGAGRPASFGRGVRVVARTLRMPQEVWDELDEIVQAVCAPPSVVVAHLIRDGLEVVQQLQRVDAAGEE